MGVPASGRAFRSNLSLKNAKGFTLQSLTQKKENMREIKFRANAGRLMWSDVAVYNGKPYVWNYEETALVPLFSPEQEAVHGVPVLMQYTGLKDKNGVEIYEGDILEEHSEEENASYLMAVDFIGFLSNFTYAQLRRSEVIGNIHQHPELLTEKI